MRLFSRPLFAIAASLMALNVVATPSQASPAPEKEWTLLVFLNGHNNLDPFGKADINEMEKVGSTNDINVVVQWASLENGATKRLYVTKDNDAQNVSSAVLEEMPPVDMGDYRNLIEFVRWGATNFPAKKYFVDVWNHGSGWHKLRATVSARGGVSIQDISSDDLSGNIITTEQLGQAMDESARIVGKKIELYGSDACLMGMIEVAAEMSDSVKFFVGSQELEPGDGWYYDRLLAEWAARPTINGGELAKILTQTYFAGYGPNGSELTMSAMNLEQLPMIEAGIKALGTALSTLPPASRQKVLQVASSSQSFYYSDYVDAGDFLKRLAASRIKGINLGIITDAVEALRNFTVVSQASTSHKDATGVSIWLPSNEYSHSSYATRYAGLKFSQRTGWGEAVQSLVK